MLTYDYIHDFPETGTITIPGSLHRLGTDLLDITILVPNSSGKLIPYFHGYRCWIDPETTDVTISLFSNRHRGVVLLTRHERHA